MNLTEYFCRINYDDYSEKCDIETLNGIFLHHIRAIPFENLSLHCGETIELGIEATYNKIVRKRRGGWCQEQNHLLFWVLKSIGYEVTMHGARVYLPMEEKYSTNMSHLVLKVVVDGRPYLVDAGFGSSYQMWEPIELVSGNDHMQIPGTFCIKEINRLWCLDKIKRKQYIPDQQFSDCDMLDKAVYKKIYSFTLIERTIEDFRQISTYLQTSPDSHFLKKSICTLQLTDGFRALLGWTLAETRYNYKDNMDFVEFMDVKEEEIEMVLKDKFNLILENKFVPVYSRTLYTL